MGGKQSRGKQERKQIAQSKAKDQWEKDWETFLSSHPDFTVNDVNWEENLTKNGDEDQIRLVCISDTHCQADTMLEPVPPGDILIHSGDFTNYGRKEEVEKFNQWLGTLPHRHKIVIAGNHEITFDRKSFDNPYAKRKVFGENYDLADLEVSQFPNFASLLTNCTYLENSSIEVEGVNIYGSPHVPGVGHEWAFFYGNDEAEKVWSSLPACDVLVTHGPPLGIGDKRGSGARLGCPELLRQVVDTVKPTFHVYGHIHQDAGVRSAGGTTFVNAATCDYMGSPCRKPIVLLLPRKRDV